MVSHPTGPILYGTVAALMSCSLIFGLTISFPALTMTALIADFKFTDLESTLFNSITSAFAILGPFIFQPFMDKIGRRFSIRIISLCSFILYVLFFFSEESTRYLAFIHRAGIGIVVGGFSAIVPVYLVEIASPSMKNTFGSLNQLGISTGVVLANLFGGLIHWRSLAFIISLISISVTLFSFIMPESPAFINKNINIRVNQGSSASPSNGGTTNTIVQNNSPRLFDGTYNPEILDAILFMFFQQFSGVNGLLTNVGMLLNNNASAATLSASAQCIACVFCSAAISKLGIKITWIISCVGALSSLILLAVSQTLNLSIFMNGVAIFAFQLSFGFGLGPIPWMMTPILFPDAVRSQASSLLSSLNWLLSFLVIFIFPVLKNSFGVNTTALIFAGVMGAATVFGIILKMPAEEEEVEFEPDLADDVEN